MRPNVFKCIIFFLLVFSVSCGDKALFDELATNRLQVILKGTYESNNPRDWVSSDINYDDSVDDYSNLENLPTVFLLDIAQLELNKRRFAKQRMTFQFPLFDEQSEFFNGSGVYYDNDDPQQWFFDTVQIFFRKMLMDGAKIYYKDSDDNWIFSENYTTLFKEDDVEAYNFNNLLLNSYYDSLREEGERINRVFPLSVPIDNGLVFSTRYDSMVLEVRLVIKNFLKMYEYDYYDSYHKVIHYFALSDWLRDLEADEYYLGGNLLAVARCYIPGETVTLTGSAPSERYVVAIRGDEDINDYYAADRTRPTCKEPTEPISPISADIESYMDYYLEIEEYKERYNNFVSCTNAANYNSQYANPWTAYDDGLLDFKIPPMATWVDTSVTTFTLTNVPVGETYKVYYWDSAVNGGELPGSEVSGDFQLIGEVTITAGQAGDTVTVP